VALSVSFVFVMLLTAHYVVAAIFVVLAGLVLSAWHAREPIEQ
jgi:hypothetical protein